MTILRHSPGSARFAPLISVLLLATASSGSLGCSEAPAGPDLPPAEALRRSFPEQARVVLAPDDAFVSTAEGFALKTTPAAGVGRRVEVTLPREGQGVTRMRDSGGFEVQVREQGALGGTLGEGVLAERAVAYRRAGGTSFWTAVPGGVEEWLHLEADAVRRGEPVAAWDVEGATVRPRGEAAELVDAGGVARLRVTAPAAYGAGGRAIRTWLQGQGTRLSLWVDAEAEAVLVDPLWTSGASMSVERSAATVTLLPSGKVLVVGGQNNSGAVASVELYDPGANTWKAAASLKVARYHHTATVLQDGRVLVAGGETSVTHLTDAELYDPQADSWTTAISLAFARANHTATLLSDGKVLVTGGQNSQLEPLASAELYDPSVENWLPATALATARHSHTATVLPDGQVLISGGQDSKLAALTSAELYDPTTAMWTPAAALTTGRYAHTATVLPDGQVLVVGGHATVGTLASAELYDPAAKKWTATPALKSVRYEHTATLLPSGKALMAGGYDSSFDPVASAELYDPKTNTWTPTASLADARAEHGAVLLPSTKVLVVGGFGVGAFLTSAELYNALDVQGTACTSAADCQSGFCADGVCCDTACTDVCVACTAVKKGGGADGTCGPIPAAQCDIENGSSSSSTGGGSDGSGSSSVSGGGSGSGGAGGGASTGGEGEPGDKGGCGCRMTAGDAAGAPWIGMGIGLLLLGRRRRATRR